jgi:triosephosphate isomerase (TIM)
MLAQLEIRVLIGLPGGNMRKLIVGNWKMNGTSAALDEIGLIAQCAAKFDAVDSALCLPTTLIASAAQRYPDFAIGGQDCHAKVSGAHTGCISAEMLVDVGTRMVILGHSERRADQGESSEDIEAKALAAAHLQLPVIICVGETEAERDAGQAESIVISQLDGSLPDNIDANRTSVAYEPVWAIGTGRIPSNDEVRDMHAAIRARLVSRFGDEGSQVRILYGGSMNGENAAELLGIANVDGGLVGGASLTAAKFEPILAAAAKA